MSKRILFFGIITLLSVSLLFTFCGGGGETTTSTTITTGTTQPITTTSTTTTVSVPVFTGAALSGCQGGFTGGSFGTATSTPYNFQGTDDLATVKAAIIANGSTTAYSVSYEIEGIITELYGTGNTRGNIQDQTGGIVFYDLTTGLGANSVADRVKCSVTEALNYFATPQIKSMSCTTVNSGNQIYVNVISDITSIANARALEGTQVSVTGDVSAVADCGGWNCVTLTGKNATPRVDSGKSFTVGNNYTFVGPVSYYNDTTWQVGNIFSSDICDN